MAFADHPSIDLANATLGNVTVYAQRGSPRGARDLKLYDLNSRTISNPPSGINTSKDEGAPVVGGSLLMFARGPKDDFFKKLIVHDLTTDTSTVLDEAYYIFPGGIEGDWLTWEACDSRCSIYRYRISTDETSRVRKPKANSIPYSPLIDDSGRVYYLNSGPRCGQQVKLYRATPGGVNRLHSFRPPASMRGWETSTSPGWIPDLRRAPRSGHTSAATSIASRSRPGRDESQQVDAGSRSDPALLRPIT